MTAVTAMPTYTDPVAQFPTGSVGSSGIHETHYFVSGHSGVLNAGKRAQLGERIAMADATGLHFDADLPSARGRDVALDQFKGGIRTRNLDCTHT